MSKPLNRSWAKNMNTTREKNMSRARWPDPHVWHNAENGIRMAAVIRDQLAKLSPENADLYTRNAQQLTDSSRWIPGSKLK